MSQAEIFETIFNQTFIYFAFYTIAIAIAWIYDRSKNLSVGVFAAILAGIMTLTYIINAAMLLNTATGADTAGLTIIIVGLVTILTTGYIGFRKYQEKQCPTILSTPQGVMLAK